MDMIRGYFCLIALIPMEGDLSLDIELLPLSLRAPWSQDAGSWVVSARWE